MLNVGILLTFAENQKEDVEASVGVANDCSLRPSVRSNSRDCHDTIGIENADRRMFHWKVPQLRHASAVRASDAASLTEHKQ